MTVRWLAQKASPDTHKDHIVSRFDPYLPLFLSLPNFLSLILLYYKTQIGLAQSPDHI